MEENTEKQKQKQKKIRNLKIMTAICGVVCAIAVCMIGYNLISGYIHARDFQEINDLFPAVEEPQPAAAAAETKAADSGTKDMGKEGETTKETAAVIPLKDRIGAQDWKLWWETQASERFPVYESLSRQNPDFVGWVRIEGTIIDYPVCQTPEDPEFYLTHDFNRNQSRSGTPFIQAGCHLEEPRSSIIIYGHHMKNGKMFASLQNYTGYGYFAEHPYIQFDTADTSGSYEIAAVIYADTNGERVPWNNLLAPSQAGEFETAWEMIKNQSFYDTGIELEKGDELLALVTCEYSHNDGRIMIIARKIL